MIPSLALSSLRTGKYIHQPERFLLYRINGNDPLNSPQRGGESGNLEIYTENISIMLLRHVRI